MDFIEVIKALKAAGIAFHVHYVGEPHRAVVSVSESVNNDQLRVLTDVGSSMTPDGQFMILTTG